MRIYLGQRIMILILEFNLQVLRFYMMIMQELFIELSIKQDLKSSFNYGVGHARGVLHKKMVIMNLKIKRGRLLTHISISKKIRLFNCFLSHILADCLL